MGGHDTQFAIMAAGAEKGELILSSGTWEILALRIDRYEANRIAFEEGVIIEADVQPGLWNPQLLMIASAVLEWIREKFYPELGKGEYEVMIQEALKILPGSNGVIMIPSFVIDSGPTRKYRTQGTLLGLNLNVTRGHVYRAALEGLSYQLKLAIEILERAFNIKVKGVRVVGGGSRNMLWNQIRADVTGLPIHITRFNEATILGAAIAAFKGAGVYKTIDDALRSLEWGLRTFAPDIHYRIYSHYYEMYKNLLKALKPYYERWA